MRGQYCQIAPDVKLGHDVHIYHFVNLYGCEIGDGTRIGSFVEVQKGVSVGRNSKLSSHTFICEGVTIEDEVFIGHGVNFINDNYPRATTSGGALQTEADWKVIPTVVKRGASRRRRDSGSGLSSYEKCACRYDRCRESGHTYSRNRVSR